MTVTSLTNLKSFDSVSTSSLSELEISLIPEQRSFDTQNNEPKKQSEHDLRQKYVKRELSNRRNHTSKMSSYTTDKISVEVSIDETFGSSILLDYWNLESIENISKEFDWINNLSPLDRLYQLLGFEDNWDNYCAPKFTPQHIEKAVEIYLRFIDHSYSCGKQFVDISPFIAPCSDGSILFDWSGKRFSDRQLEIYLYPQENAFSISYLKCSGSDEEENEIDSQELGSLFEWLFGRN